MDIFERIMVAGSNGMVGSALCKLLRKKGYGDQKVGGCILKPSRNELNLLNYSDVKEWFKKNRPSIVIIAAAKVGGILANSSRPFDFIFENIKIQTNLIEISKEFKIKKILFLGSSCIYPKYAEQPIKEEALLDSYLEPSNQWYAIAKISGIKLCESLYLQEGINAISLMPCNLYGVGDNYDLTSSHVLPALIRKFQNAKESNQKIVNCWGTGNPLREFLYVDDLAEACIFALNNWDITNKNAPLDNSSKKLAWLNVGSGKEISIKDLAEKIANIIGYEGNIFWDKSKPDGTPRKLMDSSRFKELGWIPKISLEDGIKFAIEDYKLKKNKF
ncbi:MAG: GDP-fucose synthetase [Prochlorococcus sp. SP3034]|nr:GDP-fucose synthetase [Prochlorococcus sp. SP3034]|tara:strand:- start:2217 stop:3209 length:993 start_codon:yes stop_codon:yes gene_type:complete